MLTAQHDGEMEQRMTKLGVHVVLHKPITPHELNRSIAELIKE
jgi:response regulator RpfG family c-di-GMP phosphodiesterase